MEYYEYLEKIEKAAGAEAKLRGGVRK